MDDSTLNQIAMLFYMLAAFIFLYEFFQKKDKKKSFAMPVVWTGFVIHTGSLIYRWIRSYQVGYGHAPLSNRYESFIFFSWSITVVFLIFEKKLKLRRLGGFIMPLSALAIAATTFIPGADAEIRPLMPALKSNWLLFHVVTCFLSYAAFAAAFIAAIISLIKGKHLDKDDEKAGVNLDRIMHHTVVVGFLMLTLGIISGSAWAYKAWGRYWGWDPKEVWSLVTWFVYAIFLHARVTRGWGGKKLAVISIIGFLFVIFTYLGVNYLSVFKGLHSYA